MSTPPAYQRPSFEVARHGARVEPVERDRDAGVALDTNRSALVVRVVAAGVVAVAILVTALLGGFDQVGAEEPETLPIVAVDEEFNAGPWLITVESAQMGHILRGYHPAAEGDLVLQVNARIVLIDNCVCSVLAAIGLLDVPGLTDDPVTTRSLRDNTSVYDLQPNLPVRVAFLWTIAKGTPVPKEIRVVINGSVRRYQNFRFLGETIEKDDPKATVVVPVLDRTGAA